MKTQKKIIPFGLTIDKKRYTGEIHYVGSEGFVAEKFYPYQCDNCEETRKWINTANGHLEEVVTLRRRNEVMAGKIYHLEHQLSEANRRKELLLTAGKSFILTEGDWRDLSLWEFIRLKYFHRS
jgi:hypothetical protein